MRGLLLISGILLYRFLCIYVALEGGCRGHGGCIHQLLVTNRDPHDNVVVMSADDYDSLMETLRVCRNPGLLDKVRRGMVQVRSGDTATHALVEE